jgi:prepilin-type N-terminal cleavage/methylation domain-containing protein
MNIRKEKVNSDRQKGFTLVELIVVLAVIAIVSSAAVLSVIGYNGAVLLCIPVVKQRAHACRLSHTAHVIRVS